jgi:endonuclease-3
MPLAKSVRAEIILTTLKKLYPKLEKFLDASNDYEFLFAVILSAQTTDKKVNQVTPLLFKKYPKLNDYVNADKDEFTSSIKQIGLYKTKAKNILATAKILQEKYKGKIPSTMDELLELPGVGRKTANVVLGYIHGLTEGIAVDTHVIRLSQKYGLTKHTEAKKIEKDLMQILPKDEWFHFTNRMIAYGREYCPAHTHDHTSCPITLALKKISVK